MRPPRFQSPACGSSHSASYVCFHPQRNVRGFTRIYPGWNMRLGDLQNSGFKMRFATPEDGLPCTEDWVGTFESMLFGGVDLQREPLDVSMAQTGLCWEKVLFWFVRNFSKETTKETSQTTCPLQDLGNVALAVWTRSKAGPGQALSLRS